MHCATDELGSTPEPTPLPPGPQFRIRAVWVVWAIWVKVSGRPGAFNVVCGVGVVRTHLLLAQAAGHVAALREVLDLAHG